MGNEGSRQGGETARAEIFARAQTENQRIDFERQKQAAELELEKTRAQLVANAKIESERIALEREKEAAELEKEKFLADVEAKAKLEFERMTFEREKHKAELEAEMKEKETAANNQKLETDYKHEEKMTELADQKQKHDDEHTHLMQKLELEKKKVEDNKEIELEKVQGRKQQDALQHKLAMAELEKKGDQTNMIGDLLKTMINGNVSATELAYIALASSSAIRGEQTDLKALELVGQHHKMMEEAKLGLKHSVDHQAPRRQALKQPLTQEADEEENAEIFSASTEIEQQ